ncbi:MAG: sodium:solute symporter [Flavobacteriales bacterium]|nr:sodium:solute symporter [Flavobacteriales bacterium]
MSGSIIIAAIVLYFLTLIVIARLTSKGANNDSFFLGNRKSPWYIVAFGMIGASLSGVTFVSVPGWVDGSQFSYMQMVLGYLAGYLVIGTVLLPLYYRLQLTSIYTYLKDRLGIGSYKTGAAFFLLSRIIGASFRLYLVALVLNDFVFPSVGLQVPFVVTVALTIGLIWLYTNKGGIKTIIWTDTLQTAFMLVAAIIAFVGVMNALDLEWGQVWEAIAADDRSRVFFFDDASSGKYFFKRFIAGAFIAIAMTGLDQDMMQKNLSCRNLRDAQKNMFWFSIILVFVNLLFLGLGVLLYQYAQAAGIEALGDNLFPAIALGSALGPAVGVFFILGLVAAAYSSADSALTALTTSFCVDILGMSEDNERASALRKRVHLGMSLALLLVIMIFRFIDNPSVISQVFSVAGYTYGPLLGLYAFSLFTRRGVRDQLVPIVAVLSPFIGYGIKEMALKYWQFEISFELLLINGLITFLGLLLISHSANAKSAPVQ